jgi:hypothetical protein
MTTYGKTVGRCGSWRKVYNCENNISLLQDYTVPCDSDSLLLITE